MSQSNRTLFRILYDELNRRGVLRMAGVYVVASWAAIQASDLLYEPLGFEASPVKAVIVIALIGFPVVIGGAWFFNLTRDADNTSGDLTPAQARMAMLGSIAFGTAVLLFGGWVALRPTAGASESGSSADQPLSPNRVAVLYFDQRDTTSAHSYLASTLTESLISELSKVASLRVISSNGVRQFRGSDATPDSIARVLQVGTILSGTVTVQGDSLRVLYTAVAPDGSVLESKRFTRPASQSFELVDDVVGKVESFLRERIGITVRLGEWRAGTENPAAFELFRRARYYALRAREYQNTLGGESALKALALADSLAAGAEELDRRFVAATNLRASLAYGSAFVYGRPDAANPAAMKLAINEGIAHATSALRKDRSNAEALEWRGSLYLLDRTLGRNDAAAADALLVKAEADLQRAVTLDTTRAKAMANLSTVLVAREKYDDALMMAERAYNADAYLEEKFPVITAAVMTAFERGDDEKAHIWCTRANQRLAGSMPAAFCRLHLLAWSTRERPSIDGAWRVLDEVQDVAPKPMMDMMRPHLEVLAAGAIARAGNADSARAVLSRALARGSADPELLQLEAGVRVLLNENDKARALLTQYFAMGKSTELLRNSRRFAVLPAVDVETR